MIRTAPQTHRAFLAGLLLAVLGALLLVAPSAQSQTRAAKTVQVQIAHGGFVPQSVTVNPGDTVTWTNSDSSNHQVVGNGFASSTLAPGQSYSHQFNVSGRYGYYDGVYPGHKGVVHVRFLAPRVNIYNSGFSPRTRTVDAGTTVTWYNASGRDHQVVGAHGGWASPVLKPGQTYARKFAARGNFGYVDGFAPNHSGTIRVIPALPAPAPAGTVSVNGNGFNPSSVTVDPGQAVTWYNSSRYEHQVIADDSSFTSPVLEPGQSFTQTFNVSGTFSYHDGKAPNHKGTVVVRPKATLTAAASSVVFGQTVTLSGAVSSGKTGETVQLYRESPSGALLVASGTSTTGGAFSFAAKPDQNTVYVVQWGQTLSPQVAVDVAPRVTFLPVPGTHYRTFRTTVNGGSPLFAGRLVHVQGLYQGKWVNLTSFRLNGDGVRSFAKPRARTVSTYRIYIDASSSFIAGWSGTQHIVTR